MWLTWTLHWSLLWWSVILLARRFATTKFALHECAKMAHDDQQQEERGLQTNLLCGRGRIRDGKLSLLMFSRTPDGGWRLNGHCSRLCKIAKWPTSSAMSPKSVRKAFGVLALKRRKDQ